MECSSGSCRFFEVAAARATANGCAWLAATFLLVGCPLHDEFFIEPSSSDAATEATGGADARIADARMSEAAAMDAPPPAVELAHNKNVSASTEQTSKGNLAPLGNDGDPNTRWSASEAFIPSWWRVDLGAAHHLSRVEIDWEFARVYGYLIEVSSDDIGYTTVVDRSASTDSRQNQSADIDVNARYVRITVTALTASPITWASFWELRVFGQ